MLMYDRNQTNIVKQTIKKKNRLNDLQQSPPSSIRLVIRRYNNRVLGLGREKEMATHSSTLAPQKEQPGRLQSMGSLRVGHD